MMPVTDQAGALRLALSALLLLGLGACGRATVRSASSSPASTPSATASVVPSVVPSVSPTGAVLPVTTTGPTLRPSPVRSTPAFLGSPPPASPGTSSSTPQVIGQGDSNKTITLPVGSAARLQLPDSGLHWSDPSVAGSAVSVTPASTTAPDVQQWDIRAVSPGQATLHSTGTPVCAPGMACPMFLAVWALTVVVP